MAPGLVGVAGTLAALGRWREAATLFGAAEALCQRTGLDYDSHAFEWQRAAGLPDPWQRAGVPFAWLDRLRAVVEAQAATALPPVPDAVAADALWAAGRALAMDEAVTMALTITFAPTPGGGVPG